MAWFDGGAGDAGLAEPVVAGNVLVPDEAGAPAVEDPAAGGLLVADGDTVQPARSIVPSAAAISIPPRIRPR